MAFFAPSHDGLSAYEWLTNKNSDGLGKIDLILETKTKGYSVSKLGRAGKNIQRTAAEIASDVIETYIKALCEGQSKQAARSRFLPEGCPEVSVDDRDYVWGEEIQYAEEEMKASIAKIKAEEEGLIRDARAKRASTQKQLETNIENVAAERRALKERLKTLDTVQAIHKTDVEEVRAKYYKKKTAIRKAMCEQRQEIRKQYNADVQKLFETGSELVFPGGGGGGAGAEPAKSLTKAIRANMRRRGEGR